MSNKKLKTDSLKTHRLVAGSPLVGSLCRVTKGYERGELCVIVGETENGSVLTADGRRRKLARPKLKNLKHLELYGIIAEVGVLLGSKRMTDRKLRQILFQRRDYSAER